MTASSASASATARPTVHRMTRDELRASLSLAAIFALRMLGLFLVLPVFVLEAARYPGGDDPALVGLAMGIYGLTQAVMQVPLGLASDRIGRKKIIVAGLLVFALGSAVAALAGSVHMLVAGRALQGAGAVSAAVTALLADLTRDEVRTKGMALVGISIAAMFALSLMAAPPLAGAIGLSGLFWLTAILAVAGIVVVLRWTPDEPVQPADMPRGKLSEVWLHPHLWRLDLGVFVLHAVQMAMWVVVPALLVRAGLEQELHWQLYLPAVLVSFVFMGGLFALERRGYLRAVLRGGIALLMLVQIALLVLAPRAPGLWTLGVVMFFFFMAFNLGVYNTLQSLGLFAGGARGGWLFKLGDAPAVLIGTSLLAALWLLLGWAQVVPLPGQKPASASTPSS